MQKLNVKIKRLNSDAIIPEYKTSGAVGFDIHTTDDIYISTEQGNNSAIAGTGLVFEIPEGYELEIRGRSGNAFKYRVFSFNGTIDSDYRGEVKLLLMNFGCEPISFKKGDRVAQGVIKKIEQANFIETNVLSDTERGSGGFGSTGK